MTLWTALLTGILVGWLIEYAVDWFYWRRQPTDDQIIADLQEKLRASEERAVQLEAQLAENEAEASADVAPVDHTIEEDDLQSEATHFESDGSAAESVSEEAVIEDADAGIAEAVDNDDRQVDGSGEFEALSAEQSVEADEIEPVVVASAGLAEEPDFDTAEEDLAATQVQPVEAASDSEAAESMDKEGQQEEIHPVSDDDGDAPDQQTPGAEIEDEPPEPDDGGSPADAERADQGGQES